MQRVKYDDPRRTSSPLRSSPTRSFQSPAKV
jgi:Ca2+-binding EF-hand superfamily protein